VAGDAWTRRAEAFVARLAQRRYDLVYTDEKERDRNDQGLKEHDPYNQGSPGEGSTNGPQDLYFPEAEPMMQPTETPELVMEAMFLRDWHRAQTFPNSLKEQTQERETPEQPPWEEEMVWLEEYGRNQDENKFEDTDVIIN